MGSTAVGPTAALAAPLSAAAAAASARALRAAAEAAHRSRALALYAALLRAGRAMPTPLRRDFVRLRARRDFREARGAAPEQREALLALGETLLEQARAQAEMLTRHFGNPAAHGL